MRWTGMVRYGLGLVAAVTIGGFFSVEPAQAQTFPCSGAPGERMVGSAPGGNGMGATPLCMRDGGGSGGTSGPTRNAGNTYAAIAWHIDASDIWIEGKYNGPRTAERVALEACNRVMGGG